MKIIRPASIEIKQWGRLPNDKTVTKLGAIVEFDGLSFQFLSPDNHNEVNRQNLTVDKLLQLNKAAGYLLNFGDALSDNDHMQRCIASMPAVAKQDLREADRLARIVLRGTEDATEKA